MDMIGHCPQPLVADSLTVDARHVVRGRGMTHDVIDRHLVTALAPNRFKAMGQGINPNPGLCSFRNLISFENSLHTGSSVPIFIFSSLSFSCLSNSAISALWHDRPFARVGRIG